VTQAQAKQAMADIEQTVKQHYVSAQWLKPSVIRPFKQVSSSA
jgi:hypothetical protein